MTLKKGSKGDKVKKLQEKLGFKEPDGDFGPNTEKKLKEWQKANGLLDDGVAGPDTLKKLGVVLVETVVTNQGLNHQLLKTHIPDSVISQIPDVMDKFKINTPLRLAHFLSQCSHESGNFRVVSENLNYSATGLKKTFSRYFPENLSESYAGKPEKIASRVYGNRMGNGNEDSKEGWKFRGRGYIQLTGKDNYKEFDKFVEDDIMSNPDLVATKYPLLSAAWFFSKNCIKHADKGNTDIVVSAVTKCVNGGYNGIDDRKEKFKKYYKLLS